MNWQNKEPREWQIEIINLYPQFAMSDFDYFVGESQEKINALGLPLQDCSITTVFNNAIHRDYLRAEYCLKNCGLKCLLGKDYKKRS